MDKRDFKVEEDLSHLTEYERYCWLMLRHRGMAGKEYDSFRDNDYQMDAVFNIWVFAVMGLVVALVTMPVAPYFAVLFGAIVVVVWFVALTRERRIDHFARREFFEQNGVPNFEEYDEEPVPDTDEFFHRLRFLVYKFKSEKGYRMWLESGSYTLHGVRFLSNRPEYFANIE